MHVSLQSALSRRSLLSWGVLGAASLICPQARSAELRREYDGPRVVLIRFGGGVRRRETIDPDQTFAPFLRHDLAQRGTLFANMELDQLEGVTTSHGEGTLYLLTGKYGSFTSSGGLSPRFESKVPTLFEYLRKHYAISDREVLLINGEDRTSEEFFSFSNHHLYGVNYRCQVLSLYRYKVYRLRQLLASGQWSGEKLEQKQAELQELEALDYRNPSGYQYPLELADFWDEWHRYYRDSGLINPRGDRVLTELAVWAMQRLQPKFLMVNYQDTDYVHWGYPSHYTQGISIIDRGIERITEAIAALPEYRDNTIVCVVPDCGRDSNPFLAVPYQHHFNSRSAHEIFALFVGPGIARNQIVERKVSQVDVALTLAHLMGFRAEFAEGNVLEEAIA